MKILFLTEFTFDSCSFYRAGGIAPDLMRQGSYEIDVRSLKDSYFHWQTLMKYDIVMFLRPWTDDALTMGTYLKDLGIKLWVDHDDLLIDLPPENRMTAMLSPRNIENFKRICELADVVTVTTTYLKDRLSGYNDNIFVIPNAHNDILFGTQRPLYNREKTVLWRGSETHIMDLWTFEQPILRAAAKWIDYSFVFAGFRPWMFNYPNGILNSKFILPTDPVIYWNNMQKIAPVLMHVPLVDSAFNHCKSNIAFIEGTYFGAAVVGPAWEEWIAPGVIHYYNKDDYYNRIDEALSGKIDTEKYSANAWEYICDELLLSKINKLRVEVINSLAK